MVPISHRRGKGVEEMGKRRYLKVDPKQKRPKDHEVICDDYDNRPDALQDDNHPERPKEDFSSRTETNIYYFRTGERAEMKETPTIEKIRNLFFFALEADGEPDQVEPEYFCEMRQISLSNFRRLLAIMREYYGVYGEDGNAYHDTPSNRKYLALLALHDRLEDGVDMKSFCAEFHIGRTTFYRYLAIVEDFYYYLRGGAKVIALLGDGRYIGAYPDDLDYEI